MKLSINDIKKIIKDKTGKSVVNIEQCSFYDSEFVEKFFNKANTEINSMYFGDFAISMFNAENPSCIFDFVTSSTFISEEEGYARQAVTIFQCMANGQYNNVFANAIEMTEGDLTGVFHGIKLTLGE